MPQSAMVQSVLKALDIVQLAAESQDGMRLNEIADALGMKKTTAHNLIRTLRARGYLEKDAANRFFPGPALTALAATRQRSALLTAAAAEMRKLQKTFPQAVLTFSELTPGSIQTRLRMSPDRPGEMQYPRERIVMPYISPTAICLQATSANAGMFEQNYSFAEFGAGYWGSIDKFLEARKQVHSCGYYLRENENRRLAVAFAVPENFALGFSASDFRPDIMDQIKLAADGFKTALAAAKS